MTRTRTEQRVLALTLTLAVLGALCLLPWADASAATAVEALPVWAVLLLLPLAGLFVVHLRIGREAHEISARELGLVLGLALVPPGLYVVAHVVLATLPLLLRRQAPLKLLFNVGLLAAEGGLAVTTYRLVLGDGSPVGVRGVVATAAAVVAVDLLGNVAVEAVIRIHAGRGRAGSGSGGRLAVLAVGLLAALVTASVALLGLVLLVREPGALPLLALPCAALGVAYRSHVRLTEGHDRLALLYAFTRESGGSLADDDALQTVLGRVRELMSAEVAELHLLPRHDAAALSLRSPDGAAVAAQREAAWWAPALGGTPVHRTEATDGPGPDDALAEPLYEDGAVSGVLVVVERMGAGTFTRTDAEVFGALAGTAGVSLHNVGLVARLRAEAAVREHEARHDALTGLLNRRGLLEALDRDRRDVVVVLELAGLRDVNDALGHETGDELLVAVGDRLRAQLPGALVARLSGAEYAVAAAREDAARLRGVLQSAPARLSQVELPVSVATGSATGGDDPALLLRRAELAKNRALRSGGEHAEFEPRDESASRDRLALVADLRHALERGDLVVFFQPQLDLHVDRVTSVEALVRWTHPTLGPMSPDLFVPLAEQSGLVDQLTALVLREALDTVGAWRRAGLLDSVAVNLSARSLGAGLPAVVAAALEQAGLPGEALTLELTETAVVADAATAAQVLDDLAGLGVSLSLDDFGTGYSSLSYLRRLPLTEVKVDKSFVLGMTTDRSDAAVVHSTIALAHQLGLRVVAEGVEDEASLLALRRADCDLVQGYHLARPASRDAIGEWLAARALLAPLSSGSAPG